MSRNSTGVTVTSSSCSGTCLIFSIPRQPKVRQLASALGRGGRSLEASAAWTATLEPRLALGAGGGRGAHAATSSSSSAGWPVSARNTSSSVGWPSEKPRELDVRGDSAATASAARSASGAGTDSAAGSDSRCTGASSAPRQHAPAPARARSGSADAHVQRALADRRLELAGRALGDHAAVVDDRDAVGELVGLVEVLRAQQHGRALARRARG